MPIEANNLFQRHPLGYFYQDQHNLIFFGSRDASLENLSREFSHLKMVRIHQTHSDQIVDSSDIQNSKELLNADAHFSNRSGEALLISTADCMPIMITDGVSGFIAAVHVGWRGVENRILVNTIRKLVERGARTQDLQFFVGPHILQKNFEVDLDVKVRLQDSTSRDLDEVVFIQNKEKYFVDLNAIILAQASELNIGASQFCFLNLDTKADMNFHSYRRDHEKSGRQLSFIAKI